MNTNFVQPLQQMTQADGSRGRVISFMYSWYKHDPYPVIITTGLLSNGRIGGLNIRYLPFPVFRTLLNVWAGNPGFSYQAVVKQAPLLRRAFRTYKIQGIRNAKAIDWKAMLSVLSIIRSYSPEEMEAIKQAVDNQILARQPEIINEIFGQAAARMASAAQAMQMAQVQQAAQMQQATQAPQNAVLPQTIAPTGSVAPIPAASASIAPAAAE